VDAFDSAALYYPWRHGDPRVDALASDLQQIVERGEKLGRSRLQIFERDHREGLGKCRLRSSTQSSTSKGWAPDPAFGRAVVLLRRANKRSVGFDRMCEGDSEAAGCVCLTPFCLMPSV